MQVKEDTASVTNDNGFVIGANHMLDVVEYLIQIFWFGMMPLTVL
jgi:hypothetical protein